MIIEREACWQMKRRGKALPLRVGVDEEGDITVLDLASVHALLLTGPTGSGKSVAVHTLLAGLMGYLPPDKLQFVLIDGKGLEFVNYIGLEHLAKDPVEEPDSIRETISQLRREIESRTVRNGSGEEQPRMVVVIDGMFFAWDPIQEVEDEFWYCVEAGKSVGVHFIITSQTDRFCKGHEASICCHLKVSGQGHIVGEWAGEEISLQGEKIGDEFLSGRMPAAGSTDVPSEEEVRPAPAPREDRSGGDLVQVILLILETNRASTSHFQRKLGWGYNHALQMMDWLEELGVVSPQEGAGPRRILWTDEQLIDYVGEAARLENEQGR